MCNFNVKLFTFIYFFSDVVSNQNIKLNNYALIKQIKQILLTKVFVLYRELINGFTVKIVLYLFICNCLFIKNIIEIPSHLSVFS